MYYLTQWGIRPPRFAVAVSHRRLVTRDYAFYLENRLRERFRLQGVPLVIEFKGRDARAHGRTHPRRG